MNFYFSSSTQVTRVNIVNHFSGNYVVTIQQDDSPPKEFVIYTRNVGAFYYYSYDQTSWKGIPRNTSNKEFFATQLYKIHTGYLPSGPKRAKIGDGMILSQMPGKVVS